MCRWKKSTVLLADRRESFLTWPFRLQAGSTRLTNAARGLARCIVREIRASAKRYAALEMLQELPGSGRVTVGGDKGFDTADFVRECRNLWVTPHVAQNLGRRGGKRH